jgi:small subunit ribosomal protein S17
MAEKKAVEGGSRGGGKAAAARTKDATVKKTTAAKKTTATAEKAPAAEKSKTTAAKSTAAKAPAAQKSKTAAKSTAPAAAKAAAPAAAAIKRARPLRRAPVAQGSAQDAPAHSWRRSRRRTRVGVVSSAKQAHTVTVVVERMREHPLYKKVIRLRKKYAAHDAAGDVKAGDLVRIQESRPFSATKHWQVVEVLSRAGEAGAAAPRAADVEKYLEQAEGVDVILAPQREEPAEPVAEGTAE